MRMELLCPCVVAISGILGKSSSLPLRIDPLFSTTLWVLKNVSFEFSLDIIKCNDGGYSRKKSLGYKYSYSAFYLSIRYGYLFYYRQRITHYYFDRLTF